METQKELEEKQTGGNNKVEIVRIRNFYALFFLHRLVLFAYTLRSAIQASVT